MDGDLRTDRKDSERKYVSGIGKVVMEEEEGYLLVKGDAYFNSYYSNSASRFENGEMEIKGDLNGPDSYYEGWYVYDPFKMTFSGDEIQNIHTPNWSSSYDYSVLNNMSVTGAGIKTDTGFGIRNLSEDLPVIGDVKKLQINNWNGKTVSNLAVTTPFDITLPEGYERVVTPSETTEGKFDVVYRPIKQTDPADDPDDPVNPDNPDLSSDTTISEAILMIEDEEIRGEIGADVIRFNLSTVSNNQVSANNIRIVAHDDKAKVSEIIYDEQENVWRFSVIAENGTEALYRIKVLITEKDVWIDEIVSEIESHDISDKLTQLNQSEAVDLDEDYIKNVIASDLSELPVVTESGILITADNVIIEKYDQAENGTESDPEGKQGKLVYHVTYESEDIVINTDSITASIEPLLFRKDENGSSSSSSGKQSSSSDKGNQSDDKDSSSSDKKETSSSDSGKHLDDKDSSSSSKKEADSSSVTKDKDSSSGINEKESSSMRIITSAKGNYAIVGDRLMIVIPGVNSESLKIKGKSGVYNCITDEKTGEKTGIVTAVKKGTVKLYQTEGKKKRIVCEIKVEQPKIKKSLKLKVGKTKQMKLTGTKIKPDAWLSSNEEVVIVSADGTVCAKSTGTAVVTACINEHEYKCNIVVR